MNIKMPEEVELLLIDLSDKYPKTVRRIRNIWGKELEISDNAFIDIMTVDFSQKSNNKEELCFIGWCIIDRIHEIHRKEYGFIDQNALSWSR